jgi:hypothetical protein
MANCPDRENNLRLFDKISTCIEKAEDIARSHTNLISRLSDITMKLVKKVDKLEKQLKERECKC